MAERTPSSRKDLGTSDDELRRLHDEITKRGKVAPLYVVLGDDDFRRERVARNIAAWIVPKEQRELNLTVLDGAQLAPAEIAAHLESGTLNFLSAARRVVLVQRFALFSYKADAANPLLERLAGLPTDLTVVLEIPGMPDRRTRAYKLLAEHGVVLTFPQLTDQTRLRAFVVRQMRAARVSATEEALELLLHLCGANTRQLALEIQKLAAYVGPRGKVTEEAVRAVVSPSREAVVFELTDAIGKGDAPAALSALRNLLAQGHAPMVLLALLSNRVRLWLQARALVDRGLLPEELLRAGTYFRFRDLWASAASDELRQALPADKSSNLLAQHPYVAFTVLNDVRTMSQGAIAWGLARCLETDEALKTTTGLSDEAHLELLAVDLCRLAGSRLGG